MGYSYYYGGFALFGIALIALVIRFCCQVYGKRGEARREMRREQAYRQQVNSGDGRRSPFSGPGTHVVVMGFSDPRLSLPTYEESERSHRELPPALNHLRFGTSSPSPILPSIEGLTESTPSPARSPTPAMERITPPAYSVVSLEDSGEHDGSVSEPLIHAL